MSRATAGYPPAQMPEDDDRREQLLRDIQVVDKRMKAERRRHEEAMEPLREEMKPLLKQLSAFDVGPRELAKALGLNPRRAKRLPLRRSDG